MSHQIVIVYFSGFGHTHKIAEAVAAGAGGGARLLRVDELGSLPPGGWDQLAKADAIIFGSPTYIGNVAWQFKKFIDESSRVWALGGWRDKLAAGFTNSASMNGDKASTLAAIFTMSQQHGMLWVGTGTMPSNSKAAKRDDVNYVATFAGLAATTPSDASVDEMVPGDLQTARLFGERIASTLRRLQVQRRELVT
jgi:NAD(P)H dehydrogenase (quinone)